MLVEFVEVKIAQFVVADLVGKHVIDGHEDLMGHGYDCPLVSTASFETVKFVPQVGTLGFCLWQQAAAEGSTVIVGSGDNGSAQCDNFTVGPAVFGPAVSAISSTPYNVSVGGSDYQDVFQRSQLLYWRKSNSPDGESVKSYVPEMPWNDSGGNSLLVRFEGFPTASHFCDNAAGANFLNTAPDGGGASVIYAKPAWQAGVLGIPNDGRRDLPDITFPAANGAFGHSMLLVALHVGPCRRWRTLQLQQCE